MPRARQQEEADWAPVVGRALAFLCLHYAEMRSKKLLAQEAFLARFRTSPLRGRQSAGDERVVAERA